MAEIARNECLHPPGLTGIGLKSYFQVHGRKAISVCRLIAGAAAFHVTILLQNEDGFLKMADYKLLRSGSVG
jgi:hypothetical protein